MTATLVSVLVVFSAAMGEIGWDYDSTITEYRSTHENPPKPGLFSFLKPKSNLIPYPEVIDKVLQKYLLVTNKPFGEVGSDLIIWDSYAKKNVVFKMPPRANSKEEIDLWIAKNCDQLDLDEDFTNLFGDDDQKTTADTIIEWYRKHWPKADANQKSAFYFTLEYYVGTYHVTCNKDDRKVKVIGWCETEDFDIPEGIEWNPSEPNMGSRTYDARLQVFEKEGTQELCKIVQDEDDC